MWLIFVTVAIVWAVIGFVLWIPLLVRVTTVFSAMVVHATITGQRPDALRGYLESASRFYPEGFRIALDVVHKPANNKPQSLHIRFWPVFAECIWTAAFWIFLISIFHAALLISAWKVFTAGTIAVENWLSWLSATYKASEAESHTFSGTAYRIGTGLAVLFLALSAFVCGITIGYKIKASEGKKA
jgi:hypothetical protein